MSLSTGPNYTGFKERRIAGIGRTGSHDGVKHFISDSKDAQLESVASRLLQLPRRAKRAIMVGSDAVMLPIAFWLSLSLKLDTLTPPVEHAVTFACVVAFGVASFSVLGLYRAVIRFMGLKALGRVVIGVTLSVATLAAFGGSLGAEPTGLSTLAIYWSIALLYVGGSRFLIRYLVLYRTRPQGLTRVAIYGAGEAGARLSSVLQGGPEFVPVAFLDDRKSLWGSQINGITVYPPRDLPKLLATKGVHRVLLAMPSATHRRRREVLSALEPLGVHVQSLPNLSDIITGRAQIDQLREVDVCDLLGRDPVPPNPKLFESCIRGKSVMVTGAGGSIGSELCRQILRVAPERLVLIEMSELALYTIERELQEISCREQLAVEIVPLLANGSRSDRAREILIAYGVQTIYHAAAYKHVPMVEHNVIRGVENNVLCTWNFAEAALDVGTETFVLISTDKAVNPTNVMGASKRLAELVLQGLQERTTRTRFCMVRFGNVLGSSGSVVPLFQEQIRRGGPVTVTHPDVIRYFMTIPEAAQLVIQAGSMAVGGDVFVLDMGRPVRIDDLARRMVNLMGLSVRDANNAEGDIEIVYTGLRSAEKLFEELLIGGNVTKTDHPMIMRAIEHSLPWSRMAEILDDLRMAAAQSDCREVLNLLREAVAEYRPAESISDYLWTRSAVVPAAIGGDKVADFAAKRRQAEVGLHGAQKRRLRDSSLTQ